MRNPFVSLTTSALSLLFLSSLSACNGDASSDSPAAAGGAPSAVQGGSAGAGGSGGESGGAGESGGVGSGDGQSGSDGQSGGGAAAAGGGQGGEGGSAIIPSIPHDGPWRIMPLGDSITGTTCYPPLLAEALTASGRTSFEFVGSVLNNQACGSAPHVQTEGHGGYLVTDLVGAGQHADEPAVWFSTATAEVALLHFGTNDVWNNEPTQGILDAYAELVAGLRAVTPGVIVFVAQIIPLAPEDGSCPSCRSRVEALNAEIPAWAARLSSAESPIYVVDQYTGFDSATDTGDGVHPNMIGSRKMAALWSEALGAHGIP